MMRGTFLLRASPSGDSWLQNMAKVNAGDPGGGSLDKIMEGVGCCGSEDY